VLGISSDTPQVNAEFAKARACNHTYKIIMKNNLG